MRTPQPYRRTNLKTNKQRDYSITLLYKYIYFVIILPLVLQKKSNSIDLPFVWLAICPANFLSYLQREEQLKKTQPSEPRNSPSQLGVVIPQWAIRHDLEAIWNNPNRTPRSHAYCTVWWMVDNNRWPTWYKPWYISELEDLRMIHW